MGKGMTFCCRVCVIFGEFFNARGDNWLRCCCAAWIEVVINEVNEAKNCKMELETKVESSLINQFSIGRD